MALVMTHGDIDFDAVDLNVLWGNYDNFEFEPNEDFQGLSVTGSVEVGYYAAYGFAGGYVTPTLGTHDDYSASNDQGNSFIALGSDLSLDGSEQLETGTLFAMGYGFERGFTYILDVSIDVSDVLTAAETVDTSDDVALFTDNLAGDDLFMFAGRANNTAHGLGGSDAMFGGKGRDKLHGNAGEDLLLGQKGNDLLNGGSGNDILSGGAGNDVLKGGKGNDTAFFGEQSGANITVKLGVKTKQGTGEGQDRLISIENVTTGAGDDLVNGNGGANRLSGGNGNDNLYGLAGKDTLYGGGGNDKLVGGKGDDTLDGGGGADRFVFKRGDGSDIINNFNTNQDVIQIGRGASEFDDLTITQSGSDVEVTFANVSITLDGLDVADVTSDLFLF